MQVLTQVQHVSWCDSASAPRRCVTSQETIFLFNAVPGISLPSREKGTRLHKQFQEGDSVLSKQGH